MAGMLTTELSGYLGRAQCKFAIIQIALVPAWRVTKHITDGQVTRKRQHFNGTRNEKLGIGENAILTENRLYQYTKEKLRGEFSKNIYHGAQQ